MKALMLPAVLAGLLGCVAVWCSAAPVPQPPVPKEVATLRGHENGIVGLAFSPNGKTLASAGHVNDAARLWDVESGKCLRTIKGHGPDKHFGWVQVNGIDFSPDGQTVATCSYDGTVRVWDAATGKEARVIGTGGIPCTVRFGPGGQTLAWGAEPGAHLWDLATGKEIGVLDAGVAGTVCGRPVCHFTTAGKLLIAGGPKASEPGSFTVWDLDTPGRSLAFRGHPDPVEGWIKWAHDVDISPDGKFVASSGDDKVVRLWDMATTREIAAFDQQPLWPRQVRFSADGSILAVEVTPDHNGFENPNVVRFLAVPGGRVLGSVEEKLGPNTAMAFSPDGRYFAAAYTVDKIKEVIKVWRLPDAWRKKK